MVVSSCATLGDVATHHGTADDEAAWADDSARSVILT
jgi:hypothetical protein